MFTGIIEHIGTVELLELTPSIGRLSILAPSLAPALAVSRSVAVNGCCLTVVSLDNERFSADLSAETIQKSSFGSAKAGPTKGSRVNLEQPLTAGKEFGGHFVLGHADGTGHIVRLEPENAGRNSWRLGVQVSSEFAHYIVPKGSLTIDGISLTIANWLPQKRIIEIAVIPYTYEHTNIRDRKAGDAVNLEGDVLGKYVERYLEAHNAEPVPNITIARLLEEGF